MSRNQRFGFIALAVAAAVAAFVILSPGDDDEPADRATTAPQTTPAQTTPTETELDPAPEAEPEVTEIRVEGGEPVGGVAEIPAEAGELVRIVVDSDSPQEIHVHGYDIIEQAAPGSPARFEFEAELEGVFEIELEGPHTQIGELRVVP